MGVFLLGLFNQGMKAAAVVPHGSALFTASFLRAQRFGQQARTAWSERTAVRHYR